MHSFSGNLVGTGRLSLIHQDTAVKRVGNKKRPQVEPAALWYKRRNKSNKRKPTLTQVGKICKARTPRYERQGAEVALMTVDGTYGRRGILRGVGNSAAAQDDKSDGGVTPPSVVAFHSLDRTQIAKRKVRSDCSRETPDYLDGGFREGSRRWASANSDWADWGSLRRSRDMARLKWACAKLGLRRMASR